VTWVGEYKAGATPNQINTAVHILRGVCAVFDCADEITLEYKDSRLIAANVPEELGDLITSGFENAWCWIMANVFVARNKKRERRRTGQLAESGKNKWRVRIYAGRDANGKRQYICKTIPGTRRQAEAFIADCIRKLKHQGVINTEPRKRG
jgi:hypothetical protein